MGCDGRHRIRVVCREVAGIFTRGAVVGRGLLIRKFNVLGLWRRLRDEARPLPIDRIELCLHWTKHFLRAYPRSLRRQRA